MKHWESKKNLRDGMSFELGFKIKQINPVTAKCREQGNKTLLNCG